MGSKPAEDTAVCFASFCVIFWQWKTVVMKQKQLHDTLSVWFK